MYSHEKVIKELNRLTQTIEKAINSKDIGVLEQSIKERGRWIEIYNELEPMDLSQELQAIVNEMLAIDQQNNKALNKLVEGRKRTIDSVSKQKNDIKKKTYVAKKYVTVGTSIDSFAKFNRKT